MYQVRYLDEFNRGMKHLFLDLRSFVDFRFELENRKLFYKVSLDGIGITSADTYSDYWLNPDQTFQGHEYETNLSIKLWLTAFKHYLPYCQISYNTDLTALSIYVKGTVKVYEIDKNSEMWDTNFDNVIQPYGEITPEDVICQIKGFLRKYPFG